MDYEKLHKYTINKLQQMVNSGKITVEIARGICADFVPESEDEKIRSSLLRGFNSMYANQAVPTFAGESIKDILAWLEKQGSQILDSSAKTCKDEQKPTDCFSRNLCISLGQAFMKGAEWADEHQAEKDLELTWEDIVEIDKLLIDLGMMFPDKSTPDYYKEVLKRFKSNKEK